jgi:hypothetical protein
VFEGYIFNKKLTQANGQTTWRCAEVIKHKCRALCITRNNVLLRFRRDHTHPNHAKRIGSRTLYAFVDEVEECDAAENKVESDKICEAIIDTGYSMVQQAITYSYNLKLCTVDGEETVIDEDIYL